MTRASSWRSEEILKLNIVRSKDSKKERWAGWYNRSGDCGSLKRRETIRRYDQTRSGRRAERTEHQRVKLTMFRTKSDKRLARDTLRYQFDIIFRPEMRPQYHCGFYKGMGTHIIALRQRDVVLNLPRKAVILSHARGCDWRPDNDSFMPPVWDCV